MMKIEVKPFNEFTTQELYAVLQLRAEVFVVEQDCVYQDIDGKDNNALHVIGTKDGQVVAYTRIFKAGDYFNQASIGRVVVKKEERQYGYGQEIVKASIKAIKTEFNENNIHLSAQVYLKRFYADLGFIEEGEEYLEDGIPHIGMVKK
ncbi:MAG: GNAT family N-acetyltransferase [Flavobacteriaceae bacterium]|nr:MAG: GNAT family N-acetyltransferase [Flavobacteriaceae bacterium]